MDDVHLGEITVADVERVVRDAGARVGAAAESADDTDAELPMPHRSAARDRSPRVWRVGIRDHAQGAIATPARRR
jgi:hypothetical protein